ncbi:hypothetical protein K7711_21610 [Nocardia sp. CA2R105]|uniref:hypothetical protein n=1 Tax=Nocardia coffeae TaxID=2873381 RepID=UPI001CA6C89D|nr:hypothetical protein [Nocardia coffeae]MBY8859085.1 hypothetical protein [Nocardia coffeae]
MRNTWRRWLLLAIPPVLYALGLALPAVNGPQLWLGLPSLMWWVCLCAVSVSAVLVVVERSKGGDEE